MNATCGPPQSQPFATFDHDSRSWKTCQRSLVPGISESFSETWPKRGTMLNGACLERKMLGLHISARDSGSWPTPTKSPDAPNMGANRKSGPNSLTDCARMGSPLWPTPNTGDGVRGARKPDGRRGLLLTDCAREGAPKWRTPSAQEPGVSPERLEPIEGGEPGGMNRHFDKHTGRMAQIGLSQQVALRANWPTPRAQMGSLNQPSADKEHKGGGKPKRLEVEVGRTERKWPTPRACDGDKGGNPRPKQRGDLQAAVRGGTSTPQNYPTPTNSMVTIGDMEQARYAGTDKRRPTYEEANKIYPTPTANRRSGLQSHGKNAILGQLNPEWVSWLMNWPMGSTSLDPMSNEMVDDWYRKTTGKEAGTALHEKIPRVATGIPQRVARLKALGNGQVPLVAATAWRLLSEGLT